MSKNNLFAGLENAIFEEQNLQTEDNKENKEEETISFSLAELAIPDADFNKDKTEGEVTEDDKDKNKNNKNLTEEEILNEIKNNKIPETTETPDENYKSEIYKNISLMLKEEGLIENEFTSSEEMISSFSNIIKKEVEDYKETLPPVIKELINNYEEGVPLDNLISSKSEQIRLQNITDENIEENEEIAKSILINHFKATTKFTQERINKEIKRLEDLGELTDEAKLAKKELISIEKEFEEKEKEQVKVRYENSKKEQEKMLKDIHKQISSVKEIIPGLKITDKETEELYKMVTTPVEIRGEQAISSAAKVREKDPVKFDLTLNYLIKKGVFEGKWDLIMNKAETKVASKLEKQVEEAASRLMHKGTGNKQTTSKTLDALASSMKL